MVRVFVLVLYFALIGVAQGQIRTLPMTGVSATLDCERSYRADSYGRGLEAGFTATQLVPGFQDALCYALGVKVGRQTRTASCSSDFNEGLGRGRTLHAVEMGSPCYIAGYQAGRAALRVGAREQNPRLSTPECVVVYRAAYEAGYRRTGNAVPTTDRILAECYREGYSDGEWFQIEARDFFHF